MPRKSKSTSDPWDGDLASKWAYEVVQGRILTGHLMRLACERHLRDLSQGSKRGLHWRPELAKEALEFFPILLSVTAGAKVGQPFELPGYLTFVVGSLFGWYRESGIRRFRQAWLELGKGQVKSPLMAAIGIYITGWCGIQRSEVYAIAKDRNQANVLFQDAVKMCQAPIPNMDDETLESRGEVIIRGTGEMSWLIEHPATSSKFRALAGDEKVNGPRPSLVLGDEIHEWKKAGPIETWQSALVKMPGDALMILGTNTPAADQLVGTEYSEIYQRILRGETDDDAAFAVIARTDPNDKPLEDESCWVKSMPLLDLTFPSENVRAEVNSAKHRIAKTQEIKRLYFGIPVGTSEFWVDLEAWEAVQGRVNSKEMKGRQCVMALDLSQKNDLTALGIGWVTENVLFATVQYWKPQAGIAEAVKEDNAPYDVWATEGLLNLVPGLAIDYDFVAREAQRISIENNVTMMTFDPAHAPEFIKACERIGFKVWVWKPDEPPGLGMKMMLHSQGKAGMHSSKSLWMPRSLQKLEDLILAGHIVVQEHKITKWCVGNAATKADEQGNRYFVKKVSRGRIDGATVLAMLAGAMIAPDNEKPKKYQMIFV